MDKKSLLKTKKLVVANWKMNPDNLQDARKIFSALKRKNIKTPKTINVICPPDIFLGDLASDYTGTKFIFGAQNVSSKQETESTGEIGTEILKSIGVSFVIVGHSERRALGETNEIVSMKVKAAVDSGLIPILCVGEIERDLSGKYLRIIEEQIHLSLSKISKNDIKKIIIAYEPVWSIGAGHKAVIPNEVHQMTLFIKKILTRIFNRKDAMNVPILYGGSVDSENCMEIVDFGEVDGLLIGRASLNQFVFLDILKELNK
jgi:triosephosphate isomerase (TIM)